MHAPRDRRQPGRAVVDRVHPGDHREQHLRRADVRRRLLAADVLLARLQREAVRGAAVRIDGDPDEAAGHRALELVPRREVTGMRAAVAHRHAESLRRADDDVGAPLARRCEERQREEVGGDDDVPTGVMHELGEGAVVAHFAVGAGILQQHRKRAGLGGVGGGAGHDLDRERFGARPHDVDRLREDVVGHEEAVALAAPDAVAQRHRFGRRGRLVEHRRVGDRHRGEVADHRLEVDQRLEPPLRNLGLVRRVSGIPGGIFQHVAQDDAGRVRAVVALADERSQHPVLRRDRPDPGQGLGFGHGARQRERRRAPDRGGHDGVHQRGARRVAQDFEHRRLVLRAGADVPRREGVGLLERRKRRCHASPIVAS